MVGRPAGADWTCLGALNQPSEALVTFDALVSDFLSNEVLGQFEAKLCRQDDLDCEEPLEDGLSDQGEGLLRVTIPENFLGYLEVTSPGKIPMIVMLNPFLAANSGNTRAAPIPMVTETTIQTMSALIGATFEEDSGLLIGVAMDCAMVPAAGVEIRVSPSVAEGMPFIFRDNGFPSLARQTDANGLWGVLNIAPGLRAVVATAAEGGDLVGRLDVLIRPGYGTALNIFPPSQ
jgi:hypothetical protein